jgi:hypothetical protein
VESLVDLKFLAEVRMDASLLKLELLLEWGTFEFLVKLKLLLQKKMVDYLVKVDLKHVEEKNSPQAGSPMFPLQITSRK